MPHAAQKKTNATPGKASSSRATSKTPRRRSAPRITRRSASASSDHRRASGGLNRWSQHVTDTSDALDLEPDVFKKRNPTVIAQSLKRSAEQSHRRKSDPYRSAMSMLTFYINRAGHNLGASQRRVLERAKDELRRLFQRGPSVRKSRA